MTENAARDLVGAACRKYRIPAPEIRFPKNDRRLGKKVASTYHPDLHLIKLRPRHMNAAIVLHETAHAITDWILGTDLEPHGPEWAGIYMVLLEDYGIMPAVALHASADAGRVKYRTRSMVGPAVIRKRYKRKTKIPRSWHRQGWPV